MKIKLSAAERDLRDRARFHRAELRKIRAAVEELRRRRLAERERQVQEIKAEAVRQDQARRDFY